MNAVNRSIGLDQDFADRKNYVLKLRSKQIKIVRRNPCKKTILTETLN